MPIVSADIEFRLSTTAGSAGDSTAQADPNASLGKYVSTTELVDDTLSNLFDPISGDENAALTVDYRCLFVYNAHATLSWQSPKVWLSGRRCTAVGATDVITSVGHGFNDTTTVRVEAEYGTDEIPSGLDNATTYYVRDAAADTFKLEASVGGGAIDLGDSAGFHARRYGITTVAIGVDGTAASPVGDTDPQAVEIATEADAPSGVSFSAPTTKAAGLSLGTLAAGEVRAVWVRRTATNSAAKDNDGAVLGTAGDTSE